MKAGLITSVAFHAAVLGFGLLTLSAPKGFEVADVEALPVDIVPVESITQVQRGEREAPVAEKPAPTPTSKPETVADAQEVGDNDLDLKTPPTPEVKPKPVETAAAPPPEPKPAPKPVEKPEPKPEPVKAEPTPVPATEVTAEPAPKQEVKPDPVAETIVAETATPTAETALPQTAPAPEARPQPPKAQTAKAPERKNADKPVTEAKSRPKSDEKQFDADEVAALLNKEKASGGGAKRSTETASLGGKKTTGGSSLSQSELDALRGQIQRCWNVPSGALDAEGLRVSVRFRLDPSGAIEGRPEIVSGGGSAGIERAAAESARRAVLQCAPYNLPADKYETWAEVVVNFDPTDMF